MATQDYPIFEIDAEFPTAGQVTGRFEMRQATVEPGIRTGYLVDNAFSNLINQMKELTPGDDAGRKGFTLDSGGGQHYNEVRMEGLGADNGQWGHSSDPDDLDEATATGGDRVQKAQVFNRYLLMASPDSLTPARLIYGEYASGGVMPDDKLDVYIEDPSFTIDREQSSTYAGSLRFISTMNLSNPITAQEQQG